MSQAGRPLEWNPLENSWFLESLEEEVRIEGLGEEPILLDTAVTWPLPLAFRLGGEERGHHVAGRLSPGRFLILAPEAWRAVPVGSARLLAAPERTSLPGVVAHLVLVETGAAAIDLLDEQRQSHALHAGKPRLRLIGPCVEDLHPYQGPLFAPTAPKVKLARRSGDGGEAGGITTLVLGQEGRLQGRRWKLELDVADAETVDPEEKLGRRSGWYFVRAYDSTLTLVDSLDFRYFAGKVRQIPDAAALQHPAAPAEGFRVRIELPVEARLAPGDPAARSCRIQVEERPVTDPTANASTGGQHRVTLFVPPDPDADRSLWTICRGEGERVPFVVRLARPWWAIGSGDESPDTWEARPLERRLKELRPTSESILWLRVDRSIVPEVAIGPRRKEAETYRMPAEGPLSIGLREFAGAWNRARQAREAGVVQLFLWVPGLTDGILLARFRPVYTCGTCGEEFEEEAQARSHLAAHLDRQFQKLPYDEARPHLDQSLPRYIYECSYCGHLVLSRFPESNLKNPRGEIERHILEECGKVPPGEGLRKLRYIALNDTRKIRDKLGLDVSDVFRCRTCGRAVVARDASALETHLTKYHFHQLMTRS